MVTKQYRRRKRFMALGIAAAMIFGLFPMHIFAVIVPGFKVQLSEKVPNAAVKMTDKTNSKNVYTATTDDNGTATFAENLDDAVMYSVEVTGTVGFEDYRQDNVSISGKTQFDVPLTKIDKVILSGKVVDEKGAAYKGAVINLTGYTTETATADNLGEFQIPIYKDKVYAMTISSEDKYKVINKDISISANFNLEDIRLELKSYEISITYDKNGVVKDETGNQIGTVDTPGGIISVFHDNNASLQIIPNEHYHVGSILVDTAEIDLNSDPNITTKPDGVYNYTFSNVTEAHSIKITFNIDTFNISVSKTGSGTIKLNGKDANSTETTNYGSDISFTISPSSSEYTIGEITIDDAVIKVEDSNLVNNEDGSSVYTFRSVAANHTINVDFKDVQKSAEGDQDNYFSIVPVKGKLRKSDDAAKTYIYSNNAEVKLSAKEPYTRINVKANGTWSGFKSDGVIISASSDITEIYVEKSTGSSKDTMYVTMPPVKITIDKNSPAIKSIEKDSKDTWTNKPVTVSGIVSDEGSSGISKARYSKVAADYENDTYDSSIQTVAEAVLINDKYSFTINSESNDTYYVWIYDLAGNKSAAESISVNIDKKNPKISGFEIKRKNASVPAKIINFLTFGNLFNEAVELTVTAADDTVSSGLDTITLFGDGAEIETKTTDSENKAVFELSVPFDKSLTAVATDKVGLKSEAAMPNTVNSNIKDSKLMLEAVNPELTITPGNPVYTGDDGKKWYNNDAAFDVSTSDSDSGIHDVKAVINEQEILTDKKGNAVNNEFYKLGTKTSKADFVLNTDQGTIKADGSYTLSVTTTDNAGNVFSDSNTVYKDTTIPSIVSFTFSPAGSPNIDGPIVQAEQYGFFFVSDVAVTVTAKDSEPSSGVKSITYYTVDYTTNKNGVKSNEITMPVDTNNQVSLTVPANFKGQIYARATDNVDNTPDFYVKPNGTVIEDASKHTEISSITLGVPETPYKGSNGLALYSNDVSVNLGASDLYSGIKTIEWSVSSDYDTGNNQKETVNVDVNGNLSGDKDGWNKTKTDINLVTEMTKTVMVRNNSNDIKVYIKLIDRAGNISEKEINLSIDKTAPKVSSIVKSPDDVWTNQSVTVSGTVNDEGTASNEGSTGISEVRYSKNPADYEKDTNAAKIPTVSVAALTNNQYSFTINSESNDIYYVWTYDLAGNKSAVASKPVNIDTTNPKISGFDIKPKNTSIAAKVINFLTFGNFFNEAVEVTITAADEKVSSGLDKITLFRDGAEIETKAVDRENNATFELSVPFDKSLTAVASDKVGLKSEAAMPNTVNSNIKDSKLMLEAVNPELTITSGNPVYAGDDGKKWYNNDAAFDVSTSDSDSGIHDVKAAINEQEILTDKNGNAVNNEFYKLGTKTSKADFVLNTDQGTIKADGSYTLSVTTTDNAGNVFSDSKTVYKDITNPDIAGFAFSAAGSQKTAAPLVETTQYGFFFVSDATVTVTAKDNEPSSGVKSITYYTVDYTTNKNGVKSNEITVPVDGNNQISFTVPANFKGQIYAKATDNVNNTPASFVKPDGTAIENESKHAETSSITLEVPETPYKDKNGVGLYNNDVDVNVSVLDSYSGVKTIEWTVSSDYDTGSNQKGIVNVDINGNLSENKDGWNKTKTDINLVTEMTKTFTVRNNSNDIEVNVKLTDRAGNISEKEIKLSIDKTKPTISVTYDNNSYDQSFKAEREFYSDNRIAKVVIKERNFNSDDVAIKITNTDGGIPAVNSWTETKDSSNADNTVYTTTIPYTADGDYTFDISYTDLAHNSADSFATHSFTIDKTIPEVKVEYDNNNAENGNYYKAQRTATITVNEHNFETSRISILGSASDNGKTIAYPSVSTWSSNGDVYTAKMVFADDALYTFDIDYTDKAGNKAADFTQQQFYVDKNVPTLLISGVNDKSANKGDVIPVVAFSDTNFNKNNVKLTLTGANRGAVSLNGGYANVANGQVFTFKNFDKEKNVDDIYTLTASTVDMAGNKTEKSITFSVNRFGSVYTPDETLKAIEGKYIQRGTDVIIMETNVDKLINDSIKIKVTNNGVPIDLVKDKDYTVVPSGGEGKWSQYKYIINSKVFEGDAKYIVTLYSVDAAGNINENIDETKKAEIWFGVDKTKPVVVPIDLDDSTTYAVDSKQVSVSISDNLVLKDVKIYVNDKEQTYSVNGENYTFNILSSNSSQKVKIVALDAAGNELVKEIGNFYVTTNIFVRWYANKVLFSGSIAAFVILAIGVSALILFKKNDIKRSM